MDLLNLSVKHIAFGTGVVTSAYDNYFIVQFEDKSRKFLYPDAFAGFIKAEDPAIQELIMNDLTLARQTEEARRPAEHERTIETTRKPDIKAAKDASGLKKTTSKAKPVASSQLSRKRRMTFFVFQGSSFDQEYRGGYIWAPISDKAGNMPHHWTRLLDVRKGDIILHGFGGNVQAISVALGNCYAFVQPHGLLADNLWDNDGRKIDCDYTYIRRPIKTSAFTDDIIRLCQVKYSPFDKNGNGNMGYLFEIDRQLARIFVKASVNSNSYLSSIDYINELLSETDNYLI
ncbi:MAG TPA: hypothetical protein PK249_04295 [Bacillota bacterium]|nr:hypothetical protein [Bacillota bacterium]